MGMPCRSFSSGLISTNCSYHQNRAAYGNKSWKRRTAVSNPEGNRTPKYGVVKERLKSQEAHIYWQPTLLYADFATIVFPNIPGVY